MLTSEKYEMKLLVLHISIEASQITQV